MRQANIKETEAYLAKIGCTKIHNNLCGTSKHRPRFQAIYGVRPGCDETQIQILATFARNGDTMLEIDDNGTVFLHGKQYDGVGF